MNSDDPLASTSNLGMCELDMHTSHCLPLANSIIDRKGMGSRAKCTSLSHKNVTIRKKTFPVTLQQPTSASNVSGRTLLVMYSNISSSC